MKKKKVAECVKMDAETAFIITKLEWGMGSDFSAHILPGECKKLLEYLDSFK